MPVQIDTTAENNGLRLIQQGSVPSNPSAGHSLLYIASGTANGGLFVKDDAGRNIGPFLTGTANISGAGALQLIQSLDASNSASLDFNAIVSSTYGVYQIEMEDLVPQSNNVDFYMRVSTTGTFDTGNNYYNNSLLIASSGNAQLATAISAFAARNAGEISNDAGKSVCGTLKLYSPQSTNNRKVLGNIHWQGGANYINTIVNGIYLSAIPITGIQFLFSSGNIVSGSIRVYGIVKA